MTLSEFGKGRPRINNGIAQGGLPFGLEMRPQLKKPPEKGIDTVSPFHFQAQSGPIIFDVTASRMNLSGTKTRTSIWSGCVIDGYKNDDDDE